MTGSLAGVARLKVGKGGQRASVAFERAGRRDESEGNQDVREHPGP